MHLITPFGLVVMDLIVSFGLVRMHLTIHFGLVIRLLPFLSETDSLVGPFEPEISFGLLVLLTLLSHTYQCHVGQTALVVNFLESLQTELLLESPLPAFQETFQRRQRMSTLLEELGLQLGQFIVDCHSLGLRKQ